MGGDAVSRIFTYPDPETDVLGATQRPPPWHDVTDEQVREAIAGTALGPIVEALESVAVPPLPLPATLPRAIVLAGCALSEPVKDYNPEKENDKRRGVELCRLQIGTAFGQALNAWHLLVAPSGSGKDIGGVPDLLASRMEWSIGTAGSAEGLADAYSEIGNGFLNVAEFSPWLDFHHWQNKAASWMTSAWNRGWFKSNMSKRTNSTRQSRYCFPNICANIQPEVLAQVATTRSMADGFLPRFLVTHMPRLKWRPAADPEYGLLTRAQDALERYRTRHGVVSVPDAYLQDLHDMFHELDAPFPAHWGRLVNEYGPRLAVMLAVPYEADMLGRTVENENPGTVTLTDTQWQGAEVILQWFFAHAEIALASIAEDESEAKYERMLARLYRHIHRHAPVTLTEISRNCGRGTKSYERLKIIEELVSRGLVKKGEDDNTFSTSKMPPPTDWMA